MYYLRFVCDFNDFMSLRMNTSICTLIVIGENISNIVLITLNTFR